MGNNACTKSHWETMSVPKATGNNAAHHKSVFEWQFEQSQHKRFLTQQMWSSSQYCISTVLTNLLAGLIVVNMPQHDQFSTEASQSTSADVFINDHWVP